MAGNRILENMSSSQYKCLSLLIIYFLFDHSKTRSLSENDNFLSKGQNNICLEQGYKQQLYRTIGEKIGYVCLEQWERKQYMSGTVGDKIVYVCLGQQEIKQYMSDWKSRREYSMCLTGKEGNKIKQYLFGTEEV